ncbi:MAG: von Willebrand factor type A domain-containing protein [bacterium]
MTCDTVKMRLIEYLSGAVDEATRQEVDHHLAICSRCRAEVEEFRVTLDLLHRGLASRKGQTLRLDAAHRSQVMKTVPGNRKTSKRPVIWWVKWQPLLSTAAAMLLLFVMAALFMPASSRSHQYVQKGFGVSRKGGGSTRFYSVPTACMDARPAKTVSGEMLEDVSPETTIVTMDRDEEAREVDRVSKTVNTEFGQLAPASSVSAMASLPSEAGNGEIVDSKGFVRVGGKPILAVGGEVAVAESNLRMPEATKSRSSGVQMDELRSDKYSRATKFSRATEQAFKYASGNAMSDPSDASGDEGSDGDRKKGEPPGNTVNSPMPTHEEVAMAKSPFVMRGLNGTRTKGGRMGSLRTYGGSIEGAARADEPRDNEPAKPSSGPAGAGPGDKLMAQGYGVGSGESRVLLDYAERDRIEALKEKETGRIKANAKAEKKRLESSEVEVEEPAPVYNQEIVTAGNPFSTFAIDVDTASFTRARKFLLGGTLPPSGAVRVEEFINAFEYAYPSPDRHAFSVYTDRVRSPFRSHLELLRIGVRGKVIGRDRQRTSVLTLVIDTSGSMNTPDRLDLIKASLRLLLLNLSPADRISIVTFGSEARLLLDDVPLSENKAILAQLDSIQATGSTQLEGGLKLGYETAVRHFRSGSVNRVLLLSDGVANLGAGTAEEILSQVAAARQQGVYCSVFGFGQGPYNDAMLETLADKGDGVYRFVDSLAEARQVFVDDLAATLHVIARDVKIQVEFDPNRVKSYRQVGYENRALTKEQFRDDKVDAGEVGSGQSVTALYEIAVQGNAADPLGTVRLRWKDPESGQVEEMAHMIRASDRYENFTQAPVRFRLAAGAAEFADHLRNNPLVMGSEMAEVGRVIRSVGLELNLDQKVADLVRMVSMAEKLMK